jgi:hypothetical protein
MAKAPSKIMTIAEKKIAQTNLKVALTQHNASVKAIDVDTKAAEKALAAAKKSADTVAKEAAKTAAAVAKASDTAVKAAQKAYEAAVAKAAKAKDAAAKGTAKLTGQMAALDAVVAVKDAPVPKAPKVVKQEAVAA